MGGRLVWLPGWVVACLELGLRWGAWGRSGGVGRVGRGGIPVLAYGGGGLRCRADWAVPAGSVILFDGIFFLSLVAGW